ncbi:MAG: hypothetical protein ACK452_10430, partial [Bacteroidota bacterium]
MQSLYAFFQSDSTEIDKSEKEMIRSFRGVEDLYHWLLFMLTNIRDASIEIIQEAKNKRFPTSLDLNPNTVFIDNRFLSALSTDTELKVFFEK